MVPFRARRSAPVLNCVLNLLISAIKGLVVVGFILPSRVILDAAQLRERAHFELHTIDLAANDKRLIERVECLIFVRLFICRIAALVVYFGLTLQIAFSLIES